MPGLDGRQDFDGDEQDQAETFDEDNFDASDPGFDTSEMRTFEEIPDVYDVTTRQGDADDDEALIGEELDDEDIIEIELDAEDGDGEPDYEDIDEVQGELELAGEVELIDAGDLDEASVRTLKENRYLESPRLDDKDIEDLGYGPPGGKPPV
jgi:hypothetical protein